VIFNGQDDNGAIECAKHQVRYLRGTTDWGILFQKRSDGMTEVEGYSDSNWEDPNSPAKRSTSGYAFALAGVANPSSIVRFDCPASRAT
jgi:hypothetical protein